MTKSNNEWVPSVGETCLFFGPIESVPLKTREARITALGDLMALIVVDGQEIPCRQSQLSPIKTEAKKRRDEKENWLITHIMEFADSDLEFDDASVLSKYLISLGYVQPKPLTSHDLKDFWNSHGQAWSWDLMAERINSHIRGEYL